MGKVYKRGEKWYIDYREASGKRIRKVAGTTKRQAERILIELEAKKYYEKENIPVADKIKTEELFNHFQSIKEKQVRPRTMDDWIPYLRFWKEKHLKKSKNFKPLSRIDIEEILMELSKKLAPKTVNGYLNAIKQVYRYAVDINLIKINPATNVKPFQETPRKPPRFFTKEEVKKIINNADDFYSDLFQIFLYTGMRRDEIRFLEWSDIDIEKGNIKVQIKSGFSTKTKKGRNIPMHPKVKEILTKRQQKEGYIFSTSEGIVFSRNTWRKQLLKITKKLRIKNATLHTFRHTFASWLAMEGIDLPTVAQLLGHSDIKTTMIYSHLAPDHVQRALQRLPEL